MIFSTAVVASVLTLLSFTRAATIHARKDDCTFVCPDKDLRGDTLHASLINYTAISCSYGVKPFNLCTYGPISGAAFVGHDHCPGNATQQCTKGPGSKRDGPPPTPVTPPYTPPPSWSPTSSWSPPPSWSPTPSWSPSPSKPKPNPPATTTQPCNFRCPLQDLAQNLLTDEAIRQPSLFCSYSTPHCDTCSFCKYSTKTGDLSEDEDDGNCPKNASPVRPWDRRYA